MRIIGLTGHKQSGKDTVADVLTEAGFERTAFAAPLKAVATSIGWDGTKDDHEPCGNCGMLQGRRLLQVLGTEGLREELWRTVLIDALLRRLPSQNTVITDVRFPDEAAAIRNWGGHIWRVKRPGYEGDGHESESFIDEIAPDLTLLNNGPVSTLRALARKTLKEMHPCPA